MRLDESDDLPYFDFDEVRVGRRLAELLNAGCSLSRSIASWMSYLDCSPSCRGRLADANVVIAGRRLYLRQGETITEPTGQLLIDFDAVDDPAIRPRTASQMHDSIFAGVRMLSAIVGYRLDRTCPPT